MKKIILVAASALMAFSSAYAATPELESGFDLGGKKYAPVYQSNTFGYVNESDEFKPLGLPGYKCIYYACIKMTAEEATKNAGKYISAIKFYSCSSTAGKDVKVYVADDIEAAPFTEQDAKIKPDSWNVVTLNKPYQIQAGKAFYIGYRYDAERGENPVGVSTDESNEDSNGDNLLIKYIYSDNANNNCDENLYSNTLYHTAAQNGFGNLAVLAVIKDELSGNDVELASCEMSTRMKTGTEGTFTGIVTNVGSGDVTSIELTYKVGKQKAVVVPISTNLATGATLPVNFSFSSTELGYVPVSVEVTKVNDAADGNPADNKWEGRVYSYENGVDRNSFVEMFAEQTSPFAPFALDYVADACNGRDDVVRVIHHSGNTYDYGDNYTIDESVMATFLFGSYDTFAPALAIDRTNWGQDDSSGPAFIVKDALNVTSIINQSLQRDEFIDVTETHNYNPDTRLLSIEVKGSSPFDYAAENSKSAVAVTVYLTENGIIDSQCQYNFEDESEFEIEDYVHNFVPRACLTLYAGDQVEWNNGTFEWSSGALLEGDWNADNMNVVTVVHYDPANYDDPNGRVVIQALSNPVVEGAGVEGVSDSDVRIVGTHGGVMIYGDPVGIDVYRLDGVLVKQIRSSANFVELPAGLYVVRAGNKASKVAVM